MKADVQISRVHKGSPYNCQAFLLDIEGKNEIDILGKPEVLTAMREASGIKLKVDIQPRQDNGYNTPYWTEFYITKKQGDYHITEQINFKKQTMTQLIKITEQNGKRAVSARELHQYLETQTRFYDWINRMLEYGFTQNADYQCLHKNVEMPNGGTKQALEDYALTIDTAKEIAMIQRTPKGKQARQYFIEMEQKAISQTEKPQLHKVHENNVYEKRVELLKLIKDLLQWGDIQKVASELNVNNSYVKQVLYKFNNTEKSDLVLNALYEKALRNKNELLFSYQEMIEMLKN